MYVERIDTKKESITVLCLWTISFLVMVYYMYLVFQLPNDEQAYLRGQNDVR